MSALEARVRGRLSPPTTVHLAKCRCTLPARSATASLAAALLTLAVALLTIAALACAGPEPTPWPTHPTLAATVATERLAIDGLWQQDGEPRSLVQLDRGRMYLQLEFGPDRNFGELLYADVHQSGPATYRCRDPRDGGAPASWPPCTLSLVNGVLTAESAVAGAPSTVLDRFYPVALADDVWFEAQAGSWHILSAREARRLKPEVSRLAIAPLPDLPPTPPLEKPALAPRGISAYGAYHALVIGTGDYLYLPAVATAVEDADAVSALLRERYAFDVTDLRDPTLAELNAAIGKLAGSLGKNDNLLLYFAGRGFLSEELGRCYWSPADATGDIPGEGLSSEDLAASLRGSRVRRVLVVADSCFSGSVLRGAALEEAFGGQASPPKLRTRVVLTSGGLEPIQDGSGGAHSQFTGALLQALRETGDPLDGTALFAEIQRISSAGTSHSPEYADIRSAGHEGGDFVFVPIQ